MCCFAHYYRQLWNFYLSLLFLIAQLLLQYNSATCFSSLSLVLECSSVPLLSTLQHQTFQSQNLMKSPGDSPCHPTGLGSARTAGCRCLHSCHQAVQLPLWLVRFYTFPSIFCHIYPQFCTAALPFFCLISS